MLFYEHNVKIICIDEAKSQSVDPAVLSRFNQALDLSSISKQDLLNLNQAKYEARLEAEDGSATIAQIIEFDGEGMQNWQQKLLGRIIVDGDKLQWQKSKFVKDLDGKETKCWRKSG